MQISVEEYETLKNPCNGQEIALEKGANGKCTLTCELERR